MKAKDDSNLPWVMGQKVNQEMVERAKTLRRKETPEEKILWNRLRNNRLEGYHFRRQQVILGYIVDFYCHQASLVVELEGGIHDEQQDYDRERDQTLTSLGLRLLRIPNFQVHTALNDVINQILNACHQPPSMTPPSWREGGRGVRS